MELGVLPLLSSELLLTGAVGASQKLEFVLQLWLVVSTHLKNMLANIPTIPKYWGNQNVQNH